MDALVDIVGASHVLLDPDVRVGFETDWTGRFVGRAAAVVRPGSVEEVAAVLAWCTSHRVAVVPQGGNTSLAGGSVPLGPAEGAVVLSLVRLDHLEPVDVEAMAVTAQAGVRLGALRRHAQAAGLEFGDTATVGGAVATNAGGLHALRHGSMRAQVLGVEAVLADGRVLRDLTGLAKDNTGYALAPLLCGSEGTLAVVTAARLRLLPAHRARATALVAFDTLPSAIAAASRWRSVLDDIDALEVLFASELSSVAAASGVPDPLAGSSHGVVVVVECASHTDPAERLAGVIEATPAAVVVGAAVNDHDRSRLWRLREELPSVINSHGPPHKLDVTLPASKLSPFVDELRELVDRARPESRLWLFGHLGDGNLHVNLTGVEPDDAEIDHRVLELVAAHGGSISAEHGIGRAKADVLGLRRDQVELAVMAAIKQAFDPHGILNPGVIFA
jgi:FAD/FMN-containing dehydrogenase